MTRIRISIAFSVIALLMLACVQQASRSGGPSGGPFSGGRAIVAGFADPHTLNPVLLTDVASAAVLSRIYDSLVKVDAKSGQTVPRLAEKFDVSADGKTLTFVLRTGLTWSDGSVFSGDDFLFTVEAVMRSHKTIRKANFQDIVGALDFAMGKSDSISGIQISGNTIAVQLRQPFCPAMQRIGGFPIIPRSVFGKYLDPQDAAKNLDDAPENNAPPLAMGPFAFNEWVPNDHVTLVRNERFFGGKPLLDEWVYRVYPSSAAMVAALKTGDLDAATVQPQDLVGLKAVDTLQFFSYLQPAYTAVEWNLARGGKEFFQSQNVRQALTYAADWQPIIDTIYAGQARRMVAHTSPTSWAFDPSGLLPYAHDPQKARALLEQAGWRSGTGGVYARDGQRLAFTLLASAAAGTLNLVQQALAEQYRSAGIEANLATESNDALLERLTQSKDPTYGDRGHDFDAVLETITTTADPDAYIQWHSSQIGTGLNVTGYSNAVVDQAVVDGRMQCGLDQRKAAYNTMDRQLNVDQPYDFGVAANTLLFANTRLQGLDPGAFGSYGSPGYMWNVERWWNKP